jgi:carbon-monoxide dehydrogenase medium subunit
MKPPVFDYVAVPTVEQALAALAAAGGEGKILAGGQSLMPMLNFRLLRPTILIDINPIKELATIEDKGGSILIGALARHHQVETSDLIAQYFPIVAHVMTCVAHLAIRNRGTIAGSLAHADPAAEWPMLAVLLDATIHIASPAGRRTVKAQDFFLGALTVDLGPEDLIVGVELPKLADRTGWGFEEVSRRHGDFALAAAAATMTVEDGVVAQARLALTGVGPKPLRIADAEAALAGQSLSDDRLARAVEAVRAAITPETDLHASADYRRHLAGVLARRALQAAFTRAQDAAYTARSAA